MLKYHMKESAIKYRAVKLFLLAFFVFSCEQREMYKYEFFTFKDGNLLFWTEQVSDKMTNGLEEGYWIIRDDARVISEGKYTGGFKDGVWKYYPNASDTLYVNWDKFEDSETQVSVSYPSDWMVSSIEDRVFQATFPKDEFDNEAGKHFVALRYSKSEIGMNLKGYWNLFNSEVFKNRVSEFALFSFEMDSGEKNYFSRYIMDDGNGSSKLVLNFLTQKGNYIYDVTYSSSYRDYAKKHIIFFDVLRSMKDGEALLFSPLHETSSVSRLKYPDQEGSI